MSDAIYDAGYEAPSRFYAAMEDRMGMTASDWRNGGRGRIIHWQAWSIPASPPCWLPRPKSAYAVSASMKAKRICAPVFPMPNCAKEARRFATVRTGAEAVETPGSGADIPLDVRGTAFQQRCWQALREIPAGETRSYGEQAAMLGNPKASRAVGSANGANNIAVLIPCHRVVQADGSIGGYAYGPEIKAELLRREGAGAD